ncbi:PAS domain S-box protein [Longimicrobium terrae]|uniref:histidine kinase n=1 Tax=Longimicrobium terrae TaxID=1639882 RepID=A0A841H2F3_9BACT|nr:PAS domain S-box protein [Longimicrobium terrae]MBB4637960.1 PAS domain S-box-containing protein [Longimicrobium terrae]MBB6072207.1 PAS domain S-box-containing protein [Longimicrobium terrae]NNC28367.1 PAS domain S-box protein [Longimicrobium terrae]
MSQSVSHAGLAPELARALAQVPRVGDPASSPAHRMRVLAAAAQHAARARSTAKVQAVIQAALPAAIRADGVVLRLDGDTESATHESALVRSVGDGNEVFGALCIHGGPFTEEDEAAADAFAALAADAVSRLRLAERAARAEARLAIAEDSYRTLFDLTGEAISVLDVDTREVLDVNRAGREVHGRELDEFRDPAVPRVSSTRPEFSAERGAELLARAAAGEPQWYSWTTLTRDGDEIFWEARMMRIRLGGRDVLVNVARDVRERNAAEEALRRANEQLEARVAERTSELGSVNEALEEEVAEHEAAKEALLERTAEMEAIFRALPDLFFRLADDGTVLDYRAGDSAILAAPPEAFLWRRLHDLMPAEVMEIVDRAMARARETRAPEAAEYAMDLPHGRRDFEARIVPLGDGTFVTVVRDVTERAGAERALRDREAHFRRMIENASDMVQIVGPDTLIVYTGPSMERLLGWTPEEIEGTSAMDYLHPDDVEPTLVQFGLMLQQPGVPVPASYRVRHKHGGYRWMEANAMTLAEDSGTQGVIVNARDVTERRVFEEALRLSEEQFRTLTEHSSDIPTIVSPTRGVLYVSPSVTRVLGWPQAEMMGPEARDLTHPDDLPLLMEALRAADAEPGATHSARYRVRHLDGSWRVVESIVRKTSAEAEAPLVLNTRDITGQTRAEEALRRSEEQFRLLSEHSSDVPSILSPTGESLYISPAVTRVLGYTPDEVKGHRGQTSRIHPDDVHNLAELMRATAADPSRPHGVHYRVRHRDGSWRVMETVARKTSPEPEAPLVANTRDITALRQAEEALRQREEQFRMLIEHSSDIPTIVSPTGEVIYVSPSITRMLGYLPEEMTGPEGMNTAHPDDLPVVARVLAAAAAEPGRTFSGQYRARHRDGSWRVLSSVVRKTGPEPEAPLVANTRDITEQTRAEEALREREEYFRRLIENAQDLITVIGPDGTRRFESAAIRNLYGYDREDAGGSAWDRLHPDDVAPARAALGSVMASPGRTITVELRFRAANGGWRHLECKARMLGTDPEEGIVVNSRDVTERVWAQAALREREDFFRRLTENTNDLMQVCDAEGFITYSASSSPAILGYTPEELLGRQVMDLLHPDDLAHAHVATAQVLGQPGLVDITEARFLHASGEYRWMESTARTLDPHSAASGIAFSLRDVSQRRAAQDAIRRSEEHFRRLTENASDMIVVVNEESFFLYHSPSVQRVLGYTPDELDSLRSLDVIHPDDVAGVAQALERMCAEPGTTHTMEYRFPHADGGWRTLESTGRTLLPDSAAEGIVVNSRDVTDRRAAERALRRATDEAERANRAKSEFLSRMSHELRTPMNSILGFAQILAELELAPEDRKAVQHILSAGEHLLNLINEVLDIARIESGRQPLSLEPVQAGAVLREALDLVRPLAAARGISVAETAGPALGRYVRADRQRLAQVLLNLLSNAVKYNRPGGSVRLSCRVAEGEGAPRIVIRVEDDGYGIAPDKQDQLFTPFARLGAEQSGIEGTGLGLTLSQRLVGAMGGALRLEASSERGSVFRLDLDAAENPLDRAGAPAEPAEPADAGVPAEGAAATLLYIEDNLANLSLIERVLMGRPEWRLLPALQGQLGVEMAREHVPDVVLLDLHLPDLSGEEVLRQLRADPRTAHVPVVIISADATPRTLERLRADGAAAYLTKPLNVRLFLRTVDEALAGREGRG